MKPPIRALLALLVLAVTAAADVVKYAYDDAGRLARVDYSSGASILYNYDNAGNLLSRTVNKPSNNQGRPARKEHPAAQPSRRTKAPNSKPK